MDRAEFERRLFDEKPEDVAVWAVRAALQAHREWANPAAFYAQQFSDLYNVARRMEAALDRQPVSALPPTAISGLDSEKLLAVCRPAVRHVRAVVFGSAEPPFPDDSEAALRWLWAEEDRAMDTQLTEKDIERKERAWSRFFRSQQALEDVGVLIRWEHVDVAYQPPGRQEGAYLFEREGPLFKLKQAAQEIHEATGHSHSGVLDFILTGREPALPRAQIRSRSRGGRVTALGRRFGRVRRSVVEVVLTAADISDEELRALLRSILGLMGARRRPRITEADATLKRMVVGMGHHPDAPGAWSLSRFWADAAERWGQEAAEDVTPRQLSDRYRRLLRREEQSSSVSVSAIQEDGTWESVQ